MFVYRPLSNYPRFQILRHSVPTFASKLILSHCFVVGWTFIFVYILVDMIFSRLCYVNDKLSVYFKLEDVMAIMIRLRGKSIR